MEIQGEIEQKTKVGITGKRGEMWYGMMAQSAFADVASNPGLGALVFISSAQTFQTPPPPVTWRPRHRPAGCQGVPEGPPPLAGGQLEEPGATCLVRRLSAVGLWSQGWLSLWSD